MEGGIFCKKASRFIPTNVAIKGKPILTVGSFCQWVNEDLLPNEALHPGILCSIHWETAKKWMHAMEFVVMSRKKGTFVDGQE